jgi:outer membrane protein OmpA-like peptidoglycan-associated protein
MAGMIDKTKRQFLLSSTKCLLGMTPLALGACASTEELYAEYDQQACKFVVEDSDGPGNTLTLREEISQQIFDWEPAVYFPYDKHELSDENKKLLDTSIAILKKFPQLRLGLQGFTDKLGGYAYNLALAERRVNSVQAYLREHGITDDRVNSQPIGQGLPEYGDDVDLARASNRRVELMLLDELGRPLHPSFSLSGD